MQRLPVESLSDIFVKCLPDQPYVEPNRDMPPLLFLQVCRHWRNVALQTTELWASLNTVLDDGWGDSESMNDWRMDGYAAWLSRSGNRPLSLAVSIEREAGLWKEWIGLLLPFKGRFERLQVMDEDEYPTNLSELLEGASMLKVLVVKAHWQLDEKRTLAITNPLLCLKTLVVDDFDVDPKTLSCSAWANLTHLAIRLPYEARYSASAFLELVLRCPNLETLIFGPFTPEAADPLAPRKPLIHTNLRSLTVMPGSSLELHPASRILVLPSLLCLSVKNELGSDLEETLAEHRQRTVVSPERLRKMQILDNSDFDVFDVFDVGWRNITHLDLVFHGRLQALLSVIEYCPSLQVLGMWGRNSDECATSLPRPLTYPSLMDLYISVDAPLGNFLQLVTLPALTELTIFTTACGPHNDIRDMLLRSRSPLTCLEVTERCSGKACEWTEEERQQLLASIPTLNDLFLTPSTF